MPDMRFAPPNPIRIADRASGMNAVSVRSYNERLVLSLLLQNEGLSRMDIGNRTGLSAQTVSVIVRSLEQEGLVIKGEAVKGRMGPPTIPLSLNPEGAYSVGISLGHKHTDVVMIDFVGQVKFYTSLPSPDENDPTNHSKLVATVQQALAALPNKHEGRLTGIGIAMPEDEEELALGPTGMAERLETIGKEIEDVLGIEVYVQNDITAAAAGESMFGAAKSLDDYLFFYIGARLHHRLVMNHQIFHSRTQASKPTGLIDLEKRLAASGTGADMLWERGAAWPNFGEDGSRWLRDCVDELRGSLEAASQFLPVSTVIVSSYAPKGVCEEITKMLKSVCNSVDARPGELRPSPKALGAASLPYSSKFTVES